MFYLVEIPTLFNGKISYFKFITEKSINKIDEIINLLNNLPENSPSSSVDLYLALERLEKYKGRSTNDFTIRYNYENYGINCFPIYEIN